MVTFNINKSSDLKRVISYVEKHAKFALEEVAKTVEEIIKEYILENLYNAYEPKAYTRTYNYINSLTIDKVKKEGNGYSVKLFFDTAKIFPQPPDDLGRWSRHSSITSYGANRMPDDISDMIPLWMEYGVKGSLWDRDGIYSMENAKKTMEETKYHLKKIKEVLEGRGFKVEIRK